MIPASTRASPGLVLPQVRGGVRRVLERVGIDGFRKVERQGDPGRAGQRVLFVGISWLPTLQIGFARPLQELVDQGELAWELLADNQVTRIGTAVRGGRRRWVQRRLEAFRPDTIVFCRYSGRYADCIMDWARRNGAATLLHLDDDLLRVPPQLGAAKYRFHNAPRRLRTLRRLLRETDLVYCSTTALRERLRADGLEDGRAVVGQIYCPGEVLRTAPEGAVFKIGYMGIDHAHDFQIALPALVRVLDRNPDVQFELFGPIPTPAPLERFGARVTRVAPVPSYEAFLAHFATLGWAVGICPLADTPFNRTKANTKWVEYTAVGAAVVATSGTMYDECCSDGCGLLAGSDAEWERALQALVDNPSLRLGMVEAAQRRLQAEYSMAALRGQVLEIFQAARARAKGQGDRRPAAAASFAPHN